MKYLYCKQFLDTSHGEKRLSVRLSIPPSIHTFKSIHSSTQIHPSSQMHPSHHLSIHLLVHHPKFILSSTYRNLSFHPFIQIHPSVHLNISSHQTTYIHPTIQIHSNTPPSINTHQSNHLSINPFINLMVCWWYVSSERQVGGAN